MDIHTAFGLSYSNYLVIDRDIADECSTEDFQLRETMLLQLWAAFPQFQLEDGVSRVALPGREWEFCELTEEQMTRWGIDTNLDILHESCDCGPEPQLQGQGEASYGAQHDQWSQRLWRHEAEEQTWYWRGQEYTAYDRAVLPDETLEQALQCRLHIVVPRALLQSMPQDWQEDFTALLYRCGVLDDPKSYHVVVARRRSGEEIEEPVPHYNRGRTYIEPQMEVLA